MKKPTTKEIVVRMLVERGDWMYGYELQGKSTKWGFSGVDADTRAHELSRDGYYDSPNNRYIIQHRRHGKYAQFRAIKQGATTGSVVPPEAISRLQILQDAKEMCEMFDNYSPNTVQV